MVLSSFKGQQKLCCIKFRQFNLRGGRRGRGVAVLRAPMPACLLDVDGSCKLRGELVQAAKHVPHLLEVWPHLCGALMLQPSTRDAERCNSRRQAFVGPDGELAPLIADAPMRRVDPGFCTLERQCRAAVATRTLCLGDGAVVVRAGGAREEDVVSAGTTRAREVRGEGPRREIVPRASAPGGGEVRGVRCENGARGGDPRLVSEKRLVGGEAEEGDASGRRGAGRPPGNARCDDGRESNARARTPARRSSRAP